MKSIQVRVHMDFEIERLKLVKKALRQKMLQPNLTLAQIVEALCEENFTSQEIQAMLTVNKEHPHLLRA